MNNNITYGFDELCDIENRCYNMQITPPSHFFENSKELSMLEAELYGDHSKIDKLLELEYMGAFALLFAHLPIVLYFYIFFEKTFTYPLFVLCRLSLSAFLCSFLLSAVGMIYPCKIVSFFFAICCSFLLPAICSAVVKLVSLSLL